MDIWTLTNDVKLLLVFSPAQILYGSRYVWLEYTLVTKCDNFRYGITTKNKWLLSCLLILRMWALGKVVEHVELLQSILCGEWINLGTYGDTYVLMVLINHILEEACLEGQWEHYINRINFSTSLQTMWQNFFSFWVLVLKMRNTILFTNKSVRLKGKSLNSVYISDSEFYVAQKTMKIQDQ